MQTIINVRNCIILSIFCITSGCFRGNNCSENVLVKESYQGRGYLLSFHTSQDGMGDFWFFPTCEISSRNNISDDERLFSTNFRTGISFKLPLTGSHYAQIKENLHHMDLDTLSFFREMWYTPIEISFQKIERSTTDNAQFEENLKMKLIHHQKSQTLYYIISDELSITRLEVLK